MSILDHQLLLNSFDDELMKGNVERLEIFNLFHCLRKATLSSALKAQSALGRIPPSFLKWLKHCDGGLLFDTVMLCSKEHDAELDLDFDTYEEYNCAEAKEDMGLPAGYAVFAVRSYGDPICFNTETNDGKVYLWNLENGEFEEVWETFEDWISEEIDTAIELIGEEVLDPLGVKLEMLEDEE